MIYLIVVLTGLLVGGVVNILADDLPRRRRPRFPTNPLDWLVSVRVLLGRETDEETRLRGILTEASMVAIYAFLPTISNHPSFLAVLCFYFTILVLIIVIDMEHRLILHVVTFPTTLAGLIIGFFEISSTDLRSAALGAVAGFVIFYLLYLLGYLMFGRGALGFGDVTLSMTLGAMLGIQLILPTLIIGILIGGVASLLLILFRIRGLRSHIPYGEFLAVSGMIMLLWGYEIVGWYFG